MLKVLEVLEEFTGCPEGMKFMIVRNVMEGGEWFVIVAMVGDQS
tara:strand:+ start:402 stop:533 length:132 start_codon:yes stop_codon:yes gene_type:complete